MCRIKVSIEEFGGRYYHILSIFLMDSVQLEGEGGG